MTLTYDQARLAIGAALAVPVASGLFFIMQYLIATVSPDIDDSKRRDLKEIIMPVWEIEVTPPVQDRPDDPVKPPPNLDPPPQEVEFNTEPTNLAPPIKVTVNPTHGIITEGEYLPIVKVAPIYPSRARTRGIEGHCIVEYTVTKSGSIRDPRAVDCQPLGIFERESVKAALKFKYKPRVINGEAIEVAGVKNLFTYKLEGK